jgi:peptidoglycan hydrolase CwlO-like protein
MGILQKVAALLTKRQNINKEIESLQNSCNHPKKSIKLIQERLDSTSLVIRWVCNDCSKIMGIPSKEEEQEYLLKE